MRKTLILLAAAGTIMALLAGMWALDGKEAQTQPGNEVAAAALAPESRQTKEFAIESYTNIIDGKYYPTFAPNNITVNKGDLVRLKVTVTKGVHDFNLDEFGVHAETPLDKETIVEFVADKAGEFEYYCSMTGHRQAGHWGTLRVIEK